MFDGRRGCKEGPPGSQEDRGRPFTHVFQGEDCARVCVGASPIVLAVPSSTVSLSVPVAGLVLVSDPANGRNLHGEKSGRLWLHAGSSVVTRLNLHGAKMPGVSGALLDSPSPSCQTMGLTGPAGRRLGRLQSALL
jgi:hypothetical protein